MSLGGSLAISEAEIRKGLTSTSQGECVSVDLAAQTAVVNVGGGDQTMPMVGQVPWPGDKVQVLFTGTARVCLGPIAKAPQGTVSTVPSGGLVNILGDDGVSYVYGYSQGDAFDSGSRVRLDHEGRMVIAVYSGQAVPVEKPPPPAPAPVSSVRSQTFSATDSGNFRGGAYQGNLVEVSDSRSAFYFYGAQIADTIPDSAVLLEATLTLRQNWDNVPGTASRVGTHTAKTRAGEPALSGAITVPGGSRTIDIMPFAGALARGESFGVGFYAGHGWRQYASSATSGQIYMKWQT